MSISSPNIVITQNVSCFGDSAILTLGGSLNAAQHWILYKDSCGGEALDTTTTTSFKFQVLQGTRKYFIRGEDNCPAKLGACDSLTLTAVYKDPNFNYSTGFYCVNSTDATPVISGLAGGT